jgi:TRAP-type uncharacterized transport system substrate-binding protein
MSGLFGLNLPRRATTLIAAGFLLVAAILGGLYLWSPHATLRVTTGPAGGVAQRFVSAFVATTEAAHPRIRFETVVVADLQASAKALEDRKVDIAILRRDMAPPSNGQTLVILRRDVMAIILPPGSPIKGVSQLAGKTVAIPESPVRAENSHALDLILNYYNIPTESVKRVILPASEIGPALHAKRAAVAFAVGPVGPGEVVDVVASIAKATRGTPELLEIDEGDAINARFPGFETIDIPKGAFKGRPATPGDDIKGIALTYRFGVPDRMLNAVAGALARSILRTKAKLMAITPLASQIEAPDPDEKNPTLPIHPGVAAYLSSGDQSFFDEAQTYLYAIGIPLSLVGSAIALVTSMLGNRKLREDQDRIFRLLVIADEASKAAISELDALDQEFKTIVTACVGDLAEGSSGGDQAAVSIAIEHARRSLEQRRKILAVGLAPKIIDAGLES